METFIQREAESLVYDLTGMNKPDQSGKFTDDPKWREYKERYDRRVSTTEAMLSTLDEITEDNVQEEAERFVFVLTGKDKPDQTGKFADDPEWRKFKEQYDRSVQSMSQNLRNFSDARKKVS